MPVTVSKTNFYTFLCWLAFQWSVFFLVIQSIFIMIIENMFEEPKQSIWFFCLCPLWTQAQKRRVGQKGLTFDANKLIKCCIDRRWIMSHAAYQ